MLSLNHFECEIQQIVVQIRLMANIYAVHKVLTLFQKCKVVKFLLNWGALLPLVLWIINCTKEPINARKF